MAIGPAGPFLTPPRPRTRDVSDFHAKLDTDEGWAKYNREFWRRDYPAFARFFFDTVISEPHSTKQREDAIGWALQTTPEAMIASIEAPRVRRRPRRRPRGCCGRSGARSW